MQHTALTVMWSLLPRPGSIEEPEEAGTSLFVEPLQWMTALQSGSVQGKLYCPR